MSNNYFSPNKSVSGGALFASWNSKDGSVYWKLLKQIANNPSKKDNFDGKNPLHVKLTQDEAADIIRAVRTKTESNFYHTFEGKTCTGSFKYYEIEPKTPQDKKRTGFGLTVKKTVDSQVQEIKIGFTAASAERFRIFLENALVHIMDCEYAEDVRKAKEYAKSKGVTEGKAPENIENPPESENPEF